MTIGLSLQVPFWGIWAPALLFNHQCKVAGKQKQCTRKPGNVKLFLLLSSLFHFTEKKKGGGGARYAVYFAAFLNIMSKFQTDSLVCQTTLQEQHVFFLSCKISALVHLNINDAIRKRAWHLKYKKFKLAERTEDPVQCILQILAQRVQNRPAAKCSLTRFAWSAYHYIMSKNAVFQNELLPEGTGIGKSVFPQLVGSTEMS